MVEGLHGIKNLQGLEINNVCLVKKDNQQKNKFSSSKPWHAWMSFLMHSCVIPWYCCRRATIFLTSSMLELPGKILSVLDHVRLSYHHIMDKLHVGLQGTVRCLCVQLPQIWDSVHICSTTATIGA